MTRAEWLKQVERLIDNEDVIVEWFGALVALYNQGKSPEAAAEWALAHTYGY